MPWQSPCAGSVRFAQDDRENGQLDDALGNLFAFPFGLTKFLSLNNVRIALALGSSEKLALSSLNRNFRDYVAEIRLRLGNAQINLAFHSACTNFALPLYIKAKYIYTTSV